MLVDSIGHLKGSSELSQGIEKVRKVQSVPVSKQGVAEQSQTFENNSQFKEADIASNSVVGTVLNFFA